MQATTTNSTSTGYPPKSLQDSLNAPLSWTEAAIHVGGLWSGVVDSWLVTDRLSCRSCDDLTMATYRLSTYAEFDKQLRGNKMRCECSGVLTKGIALVKVPVEHLLTK